MATIQVPELNETEYLHLLSCKRKSKAKNWKEYVILINDFYLKNQVE